MFHLSRISSCSWVRESEKNGKDGWTKNSYISYRLSEAVMFGKRLSLIFVANGKHLNRFYSVSALCDNLSWSCSYQVGIPV